MSRLQKLLDLAEAATEGPWEVVDLDHEINGTRMNEDGAGWWWVWRTAKKPYYGGVLENSTDYSIRGDDGRVYYVQGSVGELTVKDGSGHPQEKADGEFIAAARTATVDLAKFALGVKALVEENPGEPWTDPLNDLLGELGEYPEEDK